MEERIYIYTYIYWSEPGSKCARKYVGDKVVMYDKPGFANPGQLYLHCAAARWLEVGWWMEGEEDGNVKEGRCARGLNVSVVV